MSLSKLTKKLLLKRAHLAGNIGEFSVVPKNRE
jgi:hypothetical protein